MKTEEDLYKAKNEEDLYKLKLTDLNECVNWHKPQAFTNDMYKSLCEFISKDLTREALNGVRLTIIDKGRCNLEAADGHASVHYRNVSLGSFDSYIIDELGISILDSIDINQKYYTLYIEPKQRKKLKKKIVSDDVYPNLDSVIPESFDNQFHNLPTFAIDQLQRLKKCFGWDYFLPDGWNGVMGATVKYLDNDRLNFIAQMPIRTSEWSLDKACNKWRYSQSVQGDNKKLTFSLNHL